MTQFPVRQPRPLLLLLVAGMLVTGCGGGGGNGGTPPGTTAIAKASTNSGDAQTGIVAQPLATSLSVVVTEDGAPSPGATVTWSTIAAGGSVDPPSASTDASGAASTEWTLGTTSGAQTATATAAGATGSPQTFTATAVADAATTVIKAGGDNQTGEIGSQLALPVQAQVTDQHGNGVQGVAVGWAATGATVSSPSVASNASGLSSVNVTAGGTAGPIVITATAGLLTGSPLTFDATAVPVVPAPGSANITVGNNLFRSNRNMTTNPAVDTVAVNGTVTWTWVSTGVVSHSVDSEGSPSFTSSAILMPSGQTYSFEFLAPGTYEYTCAVHPGQMTGQIVVR